MRRSISAFLIVAASLGFAACGGESAEEKAQSQVCDARADIRKQIGELQGLTATTVTVAGVTSSIDAIKTDLGTIKDAQGDLDDERKQQVQSASKAFEQQVTSIAKDVGSGLLSGQGQTELKAAVNQLAAGYRSALAPIDCS